MAKLTDDTIRWILDLDANGVQTELKTISSVTQKLADDNKRMAAELSAAEKQFKELGKALDKMEESGKQNTKAYKELVDQYQAVSNEITDYKRKIMENNRAIVENNEKHKQIISTMKIEDMTMNQLKQRAAVLAKQLDDTSKKASPETYKQLQTELDAVKRRMGELGGASSNFSGMMKNAFSVFAGNMLTKGIEMVGRLKDEVVQFFNESLEAATKADGVEKAFKRIADQKYLNKLREQTQGLVDDFNLMKAAVRAEQFRIPLAELGKLLDFAQRRAQDTGESVDYMVESLISGIGRKSALKLDNLGISAAELRVKLKETGDMALAVGKIIDEKMAGNTTSIDTAAAAATRKEVAWQNLKLATGNFFVDFKKGWDNYMSNFIGGISKMLRGHDDAITSYNSQIDKVADLNLHIDPLVKKYEELSKKTNLSASEHKELRKAMDAISEIMPQAVIEWDEHQKAVKIDTSLVNAQIIAEREKLEVMREQMIIQKQQRLEIALKEQAQLKSDVANKKRSDTMGNTMTGYAIAGSLDYTEEELIKKRQRLGVLKNEIETLNNDLRKIDKTKVNDDLSVKTKELQMQDSFNSMTKKQLKAWIDDKKNANNEYKKLAEKIFKKNFDSPGEVPIDNSKEIQEKLKVIQGNLDKELALYKTQLAERKINLQQYNSIEEKLTLESLEKQLHVAGLKSYEIAEIQKKMAEYKLKMAEEDKKIEDERQKIAESITDKLLNANEREIQSIKDKYKTIKKEIEDFHAKGYSSEEEYQKSLAGLQLKEDSEINIALKKQKEEAAALELSSKNEQMLDEQQILAEQYAAGLLAKEEYEAGLLKIEEEYLKQSLELTDLSDRDKKKAREKLTKFMIQKNEQEKELDKKNSEDKQKIVSDFLGAAAALFSEHTVAYKVLAIAQASMDTYVAANKALAAYPPPFNYIAMATVIATGLANVAKITGIMGGKSESSSPSGSGTYVTNSSGYADGGFHTGYTGDGGKYDVKGYFPDGQPYHAGEYIIPQEVLAVPEVVQMIRRIEPIRKQKVSDGNSLPEGFADGGFHTSGGRVSVVDSDRMDSLVSALEAFANKDLSFNYYQFEKTKNKVDASRLLGKKR